VRQTRMCCARGARDDMHPPRTWTSRCRYRFQALADAFLFGGFNLPLPVTARARSACDARANIGTTVVPFDGADGPAPTPVPDPEVEPES